VPAEGSHELKIYAPSEAAVRSATISGMPAYEALVKEATADHAGFWARQARELLSWKKPFTRSLDDSEAPFFRWFEDGTLNVSYNCLDRHVEAGRGDKVAIIFEADDGTVTRANVR
jgi:acetyl-CoA synthetase